MKTKYFVHTDFKGKRVEILFIIGFEDRMNTHTEAVELFNSNHPSMLTTIKGKFRRF